MTSRHLALAVILFVLCASFAQAVAPQSPRIDGVSILADQGWQSNPSTIWYDSFDGPASLLSRYLEYDSDGGDFVPVAYESLGGAGQSMRAVFQRGEVGAGGLIRPIGRNPADYRHVSVRPTEDFTEVYWRFYLKNELGWTGNPAKVTRATAFAGSNWSQAMIAHVWGGNANSLCIDPASGVDENSQVVTTKYNDFANLDWLGYRHTDEQVFATAESGHWLCIEAHVKFNTPGQSDGVFELYLDGQLAASRYDLNWVGSWDDYGINSIHLENYWNAGSSVEQERYFDDFVVSTAPIGLAKSPTRPTVTKTAFRDADALDAQIAWQLQVASDGAGADIVWDSSIIAGAGDSIEINAANGTFSGGLDGRYELALDRLYALRVRQQDDDGLWSAWSPWATALQTVALTPGDANGDGLVDGADLAAWQAHYDPLGMNANTFDMGDWNTDGRVDGADLALWQAHYDPFGAGASALGGIAEAPEPATLLLLAAGLAFGAAARATRRRRP
jgi:hypothetical protein